MARPKIFTGDLPELTYEIIKYFKNDFSTLYSCVLVNRLWCRLTIPLLWENPFLIPGKNYKKNFNLIKIYLYDLNDDLRSKLNQYKIINDNSLHSKTLFNYPSFLKYLNTFNMATFADDWVKNIVETSKQVISENSILDIKRLVIISLFKKFIENEVNLDTLEIEIANYYYYVYFINILDSILQNTNFIHNIKNLKLYIDSTKYLCSFYQHNYDYGLINNRILQIINLQQNLKKIIFGNNSLPLFKSLLLLSKDFNCSNTLNTIIFYYINFNNIINLDKIFEQLNVLESVHIIHCSSLNSQFVQQIINLTKPFKLKTLFINMIPPIEPLQKLLQKSGDYLENLSCRFGSDLSLNQQFLELIIKHCKNIKHLDLQGIEKQITSLVINLIKNIKQNLKYLRISDGNQSLIDYYEFSSLLLQNLGQILPSKLEYLHLFLHIKANDFRIFLENSQSTFIEKLLIMQNGNDDILYYLKEYIMKKKRVKYLAIKHDDYDFFSFKDEVKEFKLHNIRIQNYYYLSIDIDDLVKETY